MIVYQQHIMWYESKMINETLDSLEQAIKYSKDPVEIVLCLNGQTYLEKPVDGKPVDMMQEFLGHPILKNSQLYFKTDYTSFYNIGDWRREKYYPEAKYTVWGESDCLIPEDFFYILSTIDIKEPHILSLSSRIMWDNSWKQIEHKNLQSSPNLNNKIPSHEELVPYRYYDCINQEQLNSFNNQDDVEILKLPFWKVDGSLLSLSGQLPYPFIPEDMHFVREDTCAEQFFKKKEIPQYHVTSRMKGHNYYHPNKRVNTLSTRTDKEWKELEDQSTKAMIKFLNL